MNAFRRLQTIAKALQARFFSRLRKPAARPSMIHEGIRLSSDKSRPGRDLPLALTSTAAERVQGKLRSALQSAQWLRLDLRERTERLAAALRDSERFGTEAAAELTVMKEGPSSQPAQSAESAEPVQPAQPAKSAALDSSADADSAILAWVQEETARMNRNNVTRTYAYHRIYSRHPELHWAFLAHMVSRNTGWNMTDLKGDLVPRLIGGRQIEALFQMMERANALIFQDAYPQLLLYQEGKRRGRKLAFLLERLPVSSFMPPLWEDFAETGDPVPLAIGLIVNEQNFIQGRVAENPFFVKEVLDQPFFRADSFLHVNQMLFPYHSQSEGRIRLAGLTFEDFPDLNERIRFGRKLYALLFGVADVHQGCRSFADKVPHTGSRADYWPHVFTAAKQTPPSLRETEASGAAPLHYSPTLAAVWPNRPVEPTVPADWFRDMSALAHFTALKPPASWIMDREHLLLLKAQEAAALAKSWIKPQP